VFFFVLLLVVDFWMSAYGFGEYQGEQVPDRDDIGG
jgi:hypothetical protein